MAGDFLLLVDRRDVLVQLEGSAIRVERAAGLERRIPLGSLGMVVVYGAPLVSSNVWRALARRSIPAVVVPLRGAEGTAWLGTGLSNSIQIRRLQHRVVTDDVATTSISRELIRLKIESNLQVVAGIGVILGADSLVAALKTYDVRLDETTESAALMGLEGAAAAAWYGWLATNLPRHWRFSGRNRRPPRDPLNALLSLGYTLLGGEMLSTVQEIGLDPSLGFLHGIVPGRESLVLDLIEPLRPGVDALCLELLDEVLTPGDFHTSEKYGCRLKKAVRSKFFSAWGRARWHWPVPLSAELGLSFDNEEPDWQTGSKTETAGDNSLRTQCRRMVRFLRRQLRQWSTWDNG